MKIDARIDRDVEKLNLGIIEFAKVKRLVRQYYDQGLTDGMNDITEQECRLQGDH